LLRSIGCSKSPRAVDFAAQQWCGKSLENKKPAGMPAFFVRISMSDQAPDPEDQPERWGRLVGRTLGYLFAGLLLLNLFTRWLF